MPRITAKQIEVLKPPAAGVKFVWDSSVPGFGVRIGHTGTASFVVQYRQGTKSFRKTIARYGLKTVEEARSLARDHIHAAAKGILPADQTAARQGLSLNGLWDRYEKAGFPKPRGGLKTETTIRSDRQRFTKRIAPNLGFIKVDALTDSHIEELRSNIRAEGTLGQAERTVALIKAMMAYARRIGVTSNMAGFAATTSKSRQVSNPLSTAERHALREVLADMRADGLQLYSAAAIEFLLLSGMRLSEVLQLPWRAVDIEGGSIYLRKDKADQQRGRVVHLSDDALALLASLPRVDGNAFVFVGHINKRHLVNINKPWAAAKTRAGLAAWEDGSPRELRLHDLRHTFGTAMATAGVQAHTIQRLMGHRDSKTTERYINLTDKTLKHAVNMVKL